MIDHGIGITPGEQDLIFSPMYRGRNARGTVEPVWGSPVLAPDPADGRVAHGRQRAGLRLHLHRLAARSRPESHGPEGVNGPNGPAPRSEGLCVAHRARARRLRVMNRPRFPGLPAIVDGSEAIAHVETRISEGACAYPITPSTTMAALYQAAVADGKTEPVGHAAALPGARVGALVRLGGRGLRAGRGPCHQLHGRAGPDPDEGGPVRHRRQAPAGRLPRRRTGADQPGTEHPRRP